jgi:hypothetical protein
MSLTLRNSSSASVSIAGVSFSKPEFTETDTCQGQVPASGTCTLQVSFSPDQVGSETAFVTVTFSGNALTQVVTLTGTGATPLTLQPSALVFPPGTAVGGKSSPLNLSIGNGASAQPQAYSVAVTGNFTINNSCPNPLPGYFGCTMQVYFEPQLAGLQQGSVIVTYPGLSGQAVATLTGSTTGSGVSVASSVNFGTQALHSSGSYSLSVTNSGNANLLISALTITGNNAVDFSAAPGQCATVSPGATCNIQLSFSPGAEGNRLATLVLSDNAISPPQSIALTGLGASPFSVHAAAPSPFSVNRGTPGTYPLTVSASPGFTGTIQFSCVGVPASSTCSIQPATVNFSMAASVTVSVMVTTTAPASSSLWRAPAALFASLCAFPLLLASRRPIGIVLLCLVSVVACVGLGCGANGSTTNSASSSSSTSSSSGSSGSGSTGSGSSGSGSSSINPTPTGLYELTVTASNAVQNEMLQIALNVQ